MGESPEWYSLLKAARYLGVPPWELLRQPRVWYEMALAADAAEMAARSDAAKRQQQGR
jgi:hypothetical protein